MDSAIIRKQLTALRAEVDAALGAVIDNNPGVKLALERCSFSADGSFRFALVGTLAGGKTREESDYTDLLVPMMAIPTQSWDAARRSFIKTEGRELPPLGGMVEMRKGEPVRIVGARLRAKFNVTVEKADGTRVGYKAEDVAKAWARRQKTGVAA
jgi:hypothetical protein